MATSTAERLVQIIQSNSSGSNETNNLPNYENVLEQFIKNLSGKFRKRIEDSNRQTQSNNVDSRNEVSDLAFGDYTEHDPEVNTTTSTKPRPFYRRFSFKGLTKAKALQFFHKQDSDESELTASSNGPQPTPRAPEKKSKFSKIVVECQKEGLVNLIADVTMDGSSKWEKAKMVLVKATGGYMIEFYCPPKEHCQ